MNTPATPSATRYRPDKARRAERRIAMELVSLPTGSHGSPSGHLPSAWCGRRVPVLAPHSGPRTREAGRCPVSGAPVWVNGILTGVEAARVSPLDHGLLVGDGVFETLGVYDGVPFAWRRH